jgi:hypothetical protein
MGFILLSSETRGKPTAPRHLAERLISRSYAGSWDEARGEWELIAAWSAPGGRCLCGSRITQRALLHNTRTGGGAVGGCCCCVRHFPNAAELFRALARVMSNPERPLSPAAVEWAYGRRYLNAWERDFSLDARGRHLSPRQRWKRLDIHAALIVRMATAGEEGSRA